MGSGRRAPIASGDLVALAALTAVLALSVAWHPLDDGGVVLCAFRGVTGLPCPGCGLTRSFCAMGKGELARAFEFHALGPALFAAACAYWARAVAAVAGSHAVVRRFDSLVARARLPLVALVLLCAVWAANIALLGARGELVGLARQGLVGRLLH